MNPLPRESITRRPYKEERDIRVVLRRLAQQRVVGFATNGEDVKANEVVVDRTNGPLLKTCQLRGWAEPDGGEVKDPDVRLLLPSGFAGSWRLTDAGWGIIQRRQLFKWAAIGLTTIGVLLAYIALLAPSQ